MSAVSSRGIGFLSFLVSMSLLFNLFVTVGSYLTVRRSKEQFVVTEQNFSRAVSCSVSNFLASYVSSRDASNSPHKPRITPTLHYLDGLLVFYRPYLSSYVCRYKGCEFVRGDLFEDGSIIKITSGKVYVLTNDGNISVYRPSVGEAVAASAVAARPPEGGAL